MYNSLKDGGQIILFEYPLVSKFNKEEFFERNTFLQLKFVKKVVRNMPPAKVYVFKKIS